MCQRAKWWIDARNVEAKRIGEVAEEAAELIKKANSLLREAEAAGEKEDYVIKMDERAKLLARYDEIKKADL